MNDLLLSVKVRACHAAGSFSNGLMQHHVSCPGSRMAGCAQSGRSLPELAGLNTRHLRSGILIDRMVQASSCFLSMSRVSFGWQL